MLQRYKYSGFLAVAHMMGALFARKLHGTPPPDLIVPMPLHPSRLKERGFNQAVEIGRVLSRRLNIPLDNGLAKRMRATPPQANLAFKERHRNVRGVFSCEPRLAGMRIALLDDVMTTGASLNALAQAAKQAGAAARAGAAPRGSNPAAPHADSACAASDRRWSVDGSEVIGRVYHAPRRRRLGEAT